jgi:hypothetical protein
MGKSILRAQALALVAVLGSGCEIIPSSGTETCVEWVRFESPQDQYDKAAAVLIGRSVSEDGKTAIYGYQATGHLIQVDEVLKGSPGTGNVRILSMPQTCTGGKSYPDGDPLQTSERVIIFATQQGRDWVTMTPEQGVFPFPKGAELPFKR